MSQTDLTSPRFQSDERCIDHSKGPLVSSADVDCKRRPQHTVTEEKLKAIELRAEKFVSKGACSDVSSTVDGILGETAVSELMPGAQEPDTEVHPQGDGGWDIKIGDKKVDIKTARQDTTVPPDLMISEPLNADCYLLVNRIDRRTCRLVGFEYRDNVACRAGCSESHCDYRLTQKELAPIPRGLLFSDRK